VVVVALVNRKTYKQIYNFLQNESTLRWYFIKKVIVLGAGNVGAYIASNLADESPVTLVDSSQLALNRVTAERVTTINADLSDPRTVKGQVTDHDLVVSALPESFGFEALEAVIEAGKDVVDISFWEQDEARLSGLDTLTHDRNVTAFIDCGIAPGWSNGVVAYFDKLLDGKTKDVRIYAASIPKERERVFFAAWSVDGVIEEYLRRPLQLKDGQLQRVEALSGIAQIDFPGIGVLETAITDGIRTLPASFRHIRNMSEFVLRYPGHMSQMIALRKLGYFSDDPINVGRDQITAYGLSQILLSRIAEGKDGCAAVLEKLGFYNNESNYRCTGQEISPLQVARVILQKAWEKESDDKDIVVIRVESDDRKTRYIGDLYAEQNHIASALELTTGGMGALGTRLVLEGRFDAKGLFPIEKVVQEKPELMEYFNRGLQGLDVRYTQSRMELS